MPSFPLPPSSDTPQDPTLLPNAPATIQPPLTPPIEATPSTSQVFPEVSQTPLSQPQPLPTSVPDTTVTTPPPSSLPPIPPPSIPSETLPVPPFAPSEMAPPILTPPP